MVYVVVRAICRIVCKLLIVGAGGLETEGIENIPKRGPAIIACNHTSFLDPVALGVVIPRYTWFMATNELFNHKIAGPLCRILRTFPVEQDAPDRAALRKAERLLKDGDLLVIFPEGHLSPTDDLLPIKPGSISLAIRSNAPMIPVAITGAAEMMRPHTIRLRRTGRPVRILFGKPIATETLTEGLRGRPGLDRGAANLGVEIEALRARLAETDSKLAKAAD